jgi:predicted RNA-binding Zn ribbon-like protein
VPKNASRKTTHAVTEQQVHPLAVSRALILANGDRARLRFVDERTVLVTNERRAANRPTR